jgi:hypothetical protein
VLANFERQTHADKVLIVVEGDRDRSHARNAGVARARELDCSHFAIFEDDDLYGPGYLAEHWANRDRADVLGKAAHVIQGPDGSRWLQNADWADREIKLMGHAPGYLIGGLAAATLFGRVDRALPWPEPCPPWGEECEWYTAMLRSGRTLYSTSSQHFTRLRYDDPAHGHAMPGSWRDEVAGALEIRDNSHAP